MRDPIRDEFAKFALVGILIADKASADPHATLAETARTLVRLAYALADAMVHEGELTQCPGCRGRMQDDGVILHASGCLYGWRSPPLDSDV